MVDAEKHPEGYILEGSTPVAQEKKESEEGKDENAAQVNGAASTAVGDTAAGEGVAADAEGQVIDLLDDDDDVDQKASTVGGKRKLSDSAGPSSSKMQKVEEVIELD